MRRLLFLITIFALMAATVVGVSAQTSGRLPTADVFVRGTDNTQSFDATGLSLYGSTSACSKTDSTYMQWDLKSTTTAIASAYLALHVTASNSVLATTTVTLYETTDFYKGTTTPWTEGGIRSNTAPDPGNVIEVKAAPTTASGTLTFGSQAGPSALATYLDKERLGDGVASVVMVLTGTCSQGSRVGFGDKENANSALRPGLELYSTTAVTMSSASAQQNTSWPLYAGLAAVALLVVAGVTISRRRTA